MKNKKKNFKKKGQMEKQKKINVFAEVLYNCPYLIAVAISTLIVMLCSEEIGIKAIAKETEWIVSQTIGFGVLAEELPEEIIVETANNLENMDNNDNLELENAGIRKGENDQIEDDEKLNNDNEEEKNAENSEEVNIGITKFEFYDPLEIDSYYYSDAGKVALTTEYPYTQENIGYFNDAVFLGDSRTLGISDYAGLDDADFYCDSGMTIFKLLEPDGVTCQKTGNKENLTSVLQQKKYGKIYIMLGMNELGYGNTEMYLEQYRKVVDQIREWQPEAIIYIMANLHVSSEKNNMETEFNNVNINDKNAASALLANGTDIFYLDANPLFTDSEGFLKAELSFDGVHLYAKNYDVWREFLLEHAVEPKHTDVADYEMTNQVTGDM